MLCLAIVFKIFKNCTNVKNSMGLFHPSFLNYDLITYSFLKMISDKYIKSL